MGPSRDGYWSALDLLRAERAGEDRDMTDHDTHTDAHGLIGAGALDCARCRTLRDEIVVARAGEWLVLHPDGAEPDDCLVDDLDHGDEAERQRLLTLLAASHDAQRESA